MWLIDSIRAEWREHRQFQKRYASLTLDEAGLMLGAGTVLAKRMNGALDIDGDEARARIFGLLTAAYGPAIQASVLGHIERAAKAEREGNRVLAAIHLAHAGLPPISEDRDVCHRLYFFEKLIEEGTGPETILTALRPVDELIERGNPYHDERGRFTTADGATAGPVPVAYKPGKQKPAAPPSKPKPPQAKPATQPKKHDYTAWKTRPNVDFRQGLAEMESTKDKPNNGYGEPSPPKGTAQGRYQITRDTLRDAGWKNDDGTWSEKANEAGVRSDQDFCSNPEAQEQALTDTLEAYHKRLKNNGALNHVGEKVMDSSGNELTVTEAGLMAAAHKEGPTRVGAYFDPEKRKGLSDAKKENIERRFANIRNDAV